MILWFGRQVSRSPQETCHDQMSTNTGTSPPLYQPFPGSHRPHGRHPHPHLPSHTLRPDTLYSPVQDCNCLTSPLSHSHIPSSSSSPSAMRAHNTVQWIWGMLDGSATNELLIHLDSQILSSLPLPSQLSHSTPNLRIVSVLALPHS